MPHHAPCLRFLLAGLVASTLAASVLVAAPDPGHIRIKAAATKEHKDETGTIWLAEQGFTGGDTIARDDNLTIANTQTPSLYRSERYSMSAFSLKVPNGKYVVKLHFAETFEGVTTKGERVFSFNVEGVEFKDFDVFVKAGGINRAYVESVEVEVTDGKLDITFTPKVENPEINALEIIPAK